MTNILPLVVYADPRLRAAVLLVLFGCLLTMTACQPIAAPTVTPPPPTVAFATPAPTATPSAFLYGVTVLDGDNQPIPDAQVLIEIQGKAPLENSVDEHGYAELEVPTSHAGRTGRLRVRADGFEPFNQYIDIYPDRLPNEVRLIAQIVGNTAGFCPDNLTFATGFAPAGEKETLVVVSNFADTLGNDPRNLTFDLIERMVATLAPHEQIRVERLNCAIRQQEGSETAIRIGSRSDVDASIVIWGVYVEPPEPEVRIYFDIVKQQETYLGAGFDRNFGPQLIQPSMFDFKASLGEQAGEVVAFAVGLVLFNSDEYLAAEPFFTTAIAAAEQPLATEYSRALHYYRGTNYMYLGRFLEAKPELEKASPAQFSDDKIVIANVLELANYHNLTMVYSALGYKQLALNYYTQEVSLWRKLGNHRFEAITLNNIGSIYDDLGEKQQALKYYNASLAIVHKIEDKKREVMILSNIGLVYADLGMKQEALNYYNTALTLNKTSGNRTGEATILNNIASVYADLGEIQKSLSYFNQALSLRQLVGDRAGEALTLSNIGAAYSLLGETQQALDYFNQALPIHREVGDKAEEAITLNRIGEVYAELGDNEQALKIFNNALTLRRLVGDRAGEAATLRDIGSVYKFLGRKQQALDYYKQALTLDQEIGDRSGEGFTFNQIGLLYFDIGKIQQALDSYNQALYIQRELGDRYSEAAILSNIGQIHDVMGYKQQALKYFQQALTIQRDIDDHPGEAITLSNIGIVYSGQHHRTAWSYSR